MDDLTTLDRDTRRALTPGQLARLACRLEVLAPKPGNVHPAAAFHDVTHEDFLRSADAITDPLDTVHHVGVGAAVLEAVRATRAVTAGNTNLGMVLLLAPLCGAAWRCRGETGVTLRDSLRRVLDELTDADADAVYRAIAEAQPGGLGAAERGDVTTGEVLPLSEAMQLAADRDAVARQYVTDFDTVFQHIAPDLREHLAEGRPISSAIVRAHVRQLAREPDSLIARKCGLAEAQAASLRARQVAIAMDDPRDGAAALRDFDHWLRTPADNGRRHGRNPGTTADLIAAGIFVVLHEA